MTARPAIGGVPRLRPDGGRVRWVLGLALLVLAVSTGCSLPDWPGGSTPAPRVSASTAPAAASPTDDSGDLAAAARSGGTPVQSGAVTLTFAAPGPPVAAAMQDDGSVVLTWTVPAASTPGGGVPSSAATSDRLGSTPGTTGQVPRRLAAVLAAPSGLHFEARSDRSVAVLGSGPDVVGALPRVVVVDGTGAPLVADLVVRATDPGLLDVLVDPGAAGSAALTFGATPLVSADWGEREGGRSLAVVPASWVRAGSVAALDALWSALVVVAPDADSTSMHEQLTCHALGAPTKDSWNLEPWRPEVDALTLLVARCNP